MPEESNSKFDKILEGYKPMAMGRMFYPRGMKLSEDFINSFHREYDRLVSEGQNPKSLVTRFGKAMKFHANETRKYPQLDEAAAKELADLKERNTMKFDPDSGKYHRDTGKAFGGSKRAMDQSPRPKGSHAGAKPARKDKKTNRSAVEEERSSQMQSIGPKKKDDCKRWVNGKEAPCKTERGTRSFKKR